MWIKTGLVTKKYKQQWFVTKGDATKFVIKRQASRYFYKETRVDKKGHQQYFVTKERETKICYKDTSRSNMILLERDQVILRRDKQQAFVIKQQATRLCYKGQKFVTKGQHSGR